MKACADIDCKVYVLSNLITIIYNGQTSAPYPTINNIHPISDNI